jgi:hypothetical protein
MWRLAGELPDECRSPSRARLRHDARELRRGWLLAVLGVPTAPMMRTLVPALRPSQRAKRIPPDAIATSEVLVSNDSRRECYSGPACRASRPHRQTITAPSEATGAAYYVLFGVTVGFAMQSPFSPSRKLANL